MLKLEKNARNYPKLTRDCTIFLWHSQATIQKAHCKLPRRPVEKLNLSQTANNTENENPGQFILVPQGLIARETYKENKPELDGLWLTTACILKVRSLEIPRNPVCTVDIAVKKRSNSGQVFVEHFTTQCSCYDVFLFQTI